VDGQDVSVPEDAVVLDAAASLGIHIPTLCFLEGCEASTSCMVCVVHDLDSDRLVPACSMAASEGMRIRTDDEEVKQARKDTLDMLLSEHVGDCEAPCRRACPAHMDIPLMIRQIGSGRPDEAIATVRRDIALPATLGRICPAPCEAACNRKPHDQAVSVCALKRFVADADLAGGGSPTPGPPHPSGKRVGVVGAGPAGLSAAYYLLQQGHGVRMFDRHPLAGGMLRYGVPDDVLPRSVLDAEIALIQSLGLDLRPGVVLGEDITLGAIRESCDAVVLALGSEARKTLDACGLDTTRRGIAVDRSTYQTSLPGVFAGGNALSEGRLSIRSLAHGKAIACAIDQLLGGLPVVGETARFDSRIGRLTEPERRELLRGAADAPRVPPEGGPQAGLTGPEATLESARCFQCACRKPDTCKLRLYSDAFQADRTRFRMGERKPLEHVFQQGRVVYEPGKCIKCGLCTRIAREHGDGLGVSFVGRGFDVRVAVPFGASLDEGLKAAASACVEACPTGALAWRLST